MARWERVGAVAGEWGRKAWREIRRFGRALRYAARRFLGDRCAIRAAALSYTSLLALVPVGVITLIIFNAVGGFKGLAQSFRDWFMDQFFIRGAKPEVQKWKEIMDRVYEAFSTQIKQTSIPVTVFSLGALFVTVILLFAAIEKTFDDLWRVRIRRGPLERLRNFWTIMTLGPVMAFFSYFVALEVGAGIPERFTFLKTLVATVSPYFFSIMAFYMLYQFAPYSPVRAGYALLSAAFAGFLWELLKRPLSFYLTQVITIRQIYGPIGLVPLFLVWLYFTWVLILLGAELCWCLQHLRLIEGTGQEGGELERFRGYYGVRVVAELGCHFEAGAGHMPIKGVAKRLRLPRPFVWELAETLVRDRILVKVAGRKASFMLAKPPDKITVEAVLRSVGEVAFQTPRPKDEIDKRLTGILKEAQDKANEPLSATIADLLTPDSKEEEA